MNNIKYFLTNEEADPKDSKNIRFKLDFRDKRIVEFEMTVENLTFVNDDFTKIKQWISTYGKGVGMPFSVRFTNGKTKEYILDFMSPDFRLRDRSVSCKAILRNGQTHFFNRAEGLTFTRLDWNDSDFTKIDYVIIPEAKASYLISLAIATFTLSKALIESVKQVVDDTNALIDAATPAGLSPDWGAIITAALQLAASVAYTTALIIALIKLGTEIVNLIFPAVRQYLGIKYKKLIEKGCEKLGFQFKSTLLDELPNLAILPVPLAPKEPTFFAQIFRPNTLSYTNGYPTAQDTSCSTLLRAIEQIEDIFYAKTKVVDGVVRLEQREYFEKTAVNATSLNFNLQDELQNEQGINSEEIFKRKIVRWTVDVSDFNTMDDTRRSVAEYDTSVGIMPADDLELFKGYDEVLIDFARGTRKGKLNVVEEAAKGFAKAIDLFTGGGLSAKINNRKNVLQISSQYFNKTKLLYLSGSKLSEQQYNIIGADAIGKKYHANSFVQNNLKSTFVGMPLELTESEIFNIIENNFVNLNNGSHIEILTVDWNEHEATAVVDYDTKEENINAKTLEINAG